MLPLIPILLVMTVLAADAGLLTRLSPGAMPASDWTVAWWALLPGSLAVAMASVSLVVAERSIARGHAAALRNANRIKSVTSWILLSNYVLAVLLLDWLGVVREVVGSGLLVAEVLIMVPPVMGYAVLWWSWYPIERRLHESALLQRLDRGLPIHLPPQRWPYVSTQIRMHILLLLVPMLLILAASGAIESILLSEAEASSSAMTLATICTAGAALVVFIISPWLARAMLGLHPMPAGEVRDDLDAVCRRHGVKVRDIMLWRTRGTMVNAAVMGLLPRIRYVLLTDALLEQVPRRHVLAVMAHEVGHVRCRHMPTLLLLLLSIVALVELLMLVLFQVAAPLFEASDSMGELVRLFVSLLLVLSCFGWVSRRIERQADTFGT